MDECCKKSAALRLVFTLTGMADRCKDQHTHSRKPELHAYVHENVVYMPCIEVRVCILQVVAPPLIGANSEKRFSAKVTQRVLYHG